MAHGCRMSAALALTVVIGLTSCVSPTMGARPAAPVPPTQEIVVLDPNVDPSGNPTVITSKANGFVMVEIPPSVLVHRFYHSGERSFQAQMLPGGPSVVVVNHPKTGERVYVPVVLPPGAPRVKYHATSIDYDYGPQTVSVRFGHGGKSWVNYRQQGTELGEKIHKAGDRMIEKAKAMLERTGIPDAVRELKSTKEEVKNYVIDGFRDTSRDLIGTPARNGVRMLPGANSVLPPPR